MRLAKETSVGIFVLLGLVCLAYLAVKLGRMEIFETKGYTISANFSSAAGLRTGANVEISGVAVGRVTSITLDPENYLAVVHMRIDNTIRLSDDVIASVKTSGLIGDKYIALSPGASETYLSAGATITDTESSLDFENLISNFVFGAIK